MAGAQELGRDIEDLIKTPVSDTLHFTEQERKILDLWDKEQEELRLELNLLKAQREAQNGDLPTLSDEDIQAQISQAERDLLTARSKHTIRQNIIHQVLITDPVLKSIHSGSNITALERRLIPLINERDILSMAHSTVASRLQATHASIAKLEQENIDAIAANKALAKRMLDLAEDVKAERVEEVRDARVRGQLEKLEDDVRRARTEWRVWKSVVGGVVAGSGVDWAGDARLLEVVMDEEDDMG